MKPKRIKIIQSFSFLTNGKEYNVISWKDEYPEVIDDKGVPTILHLSKWEPVQEFNHGDPVWAWDDASNHKDKGIYLCPTLNKDEGYEHYVECEFGPDPFKRVEHRKPQMTLQELADKADVNLDEVEIVD